MKDEEPLLAEIAGRIERDLKRVDELLIVTRSRRPARSPPAAAGVVARVVAKPGRGSKARGTPGEEGDLQFVEVRRGLESLEKYRAALARDAARQSANADEWEKRAKLAVRAGDDSLARECLGRKREHLDQAMVLERQAAVMRAALAEYTAAVAAIKASSP